MVNQGAMATLLSFRSSPTVGWQPLPTPLISLWCRVTSSPCQNVNQSDVCEFWVRVAKNLICLSFLFSLLSGDRGTLILQALVEVNIQGAWVSASTPGGELPTDEDTSYE